MYDINRLNTIDLLYTKIPNYIDCSTYFQCHENSLPAIDWNYVHFSVLGSRVLTLTNVRQTCNKLINIFVFTQPNTGYWLGQYVACESVSQSVSPSVTITLLFLLLILKYHFPPLHAGQLILLKPLKSKYSRRDQLRPM